MKSLKENIQEAQNPQKLYLDQHRLERHFEVNNLVYLQLQHYRQSSLKRSCSKKLKPRFCGPFRIAKRVREAAWVGITGKQQGIQCFSYFTFEESCGTQCNSYHVAAFGWGREVDLNFGSHHWNQGAYYMIKEYLVKRKDLVEDADFHAFETELAWKANLGREDCNVPPLAYEFIL